MNVLAKDVRDIFYKMSVGFDDNWLFTTPTQTSNYPPYNLTEDRRNNSYRIDMAVAGFSKDEIEIFEEKGKLTIKGEIKEAPANFDTRDNYVLHYGGLAQRGFTRNFNIAPNIEIKKVTLENGVLSINFLKNIDKNRNQIKIS
tara:strand:- start:116 stop:544 length:429 start_codon:yes stop_codon:yes gene_type:complete